MRLLDDKQHYLLLIIEELKHPKYLILALTCIWNIVGATLCSKQVNIKRKTDNMLNMEVGKVGNMYSKNT